MGCVRGVGRFQGESISDAIMVFDSRAKTVISFEPDKTGLH